MDISILLSFSLQKCTVKDTYSIELIIDKFNNFRKILDTNIVKTFICLSIFIGFVIGPFSINMPI